MTTSSPSIFKLKGQSTAFLTAFGHGAEHWVGATFFMLLPFIKKDFGISYFEAGILAALYHASAFVSNFAGAAAIDISGKRIIFLVASLTFSGFALLGVGFSDSYIVLCVLIAVIGAGNYLWHPASISFLSEQFPDNKGYIFSIHGLGASLGDMIAPIVAGILIAAIGWQQSAIINSIPVLTAALVLLVFLLPRETKPKIGDKQRPTWNAYVKSFKSLIQDKMILGLAGIASTRQVAQAMLIMFIPFYLVEVLVVSPEYVGVGLAAMQAGGFIAAPIAGTVSDRIGRRPIIQAGLLGSTLLVIALTFIENPTMYMTCLAGIGFFLFATRPVLLGWMMDIAPPAMGASATGTVFGIQSIFAMFAPLIGGLIADSYGITAVFYVVAGAIVISNLIAALLPKDTPAPATI
ncbi:MAG: MFS transporter [Rhodospirillales bacterium]